MTFETPTLGWIRLGCLDKTRVAKQLKNSW